MCPRPRAVDVLASLSASPLQAFPRGHPLPRGCPPRPRPHIETLRGPLRPHLVVHGRETLIRASTSTPRDHGVKALRAASEPCPWKEIPWDHPSHLFHRPELEAAPITRSLCNNRGMCEYEFLIRARHIIPLPYATTGIGVLSKLCPREPFSQAHPIPENSPRPLVETIHRPLRPHLVVHGRETLIRASMSIPRHHRSTNRGAALKPCPWEPIPRGHPSHFGHRPELEDAPITRPLRDNHCECEHEYLIQARHTIALQHAATGTTVPVELCPRQPIPHGHPFPIRQVP